MTFLAVHFSDRIFAVSGKDVEFDAPNKLSEAYNTCVKVGPYNELKARYFEKLLNWMRGDVTCLDYLQRYDALQVWEQAKFFELKRCCAYFEWRFSTTTNEGPSNRHVAADFDDSYRSPPGRCRAPL